jgi:hypothetical protein
MDEKDEKTLRELLTNPRALALIAGLLILSASAVWFFAKNSGDGEVRALKEQVNLVKEQLSWSQARAKAISEECLVTSTPKPSGLGATSPTRATGAALSQESAGPKQPATGRSSNVTTYPRITDSTNVSKDEVRSLAEYYGLFRNWNVNPHLKFQTGDVSFFFEQHLSETVYQLQFDSRRIVLERAEQTGRRIPTQGDLSALAQEIQAQLIK